MKALVGTVPHLPWWILKNMSDVEIAEFNRKHLVEVKMVSNVEILADQQNINIKVWEREIWNAAIEAAIDKVRYIVGQEMLAKLRELKK